MPRLTVLIATFNHEPFVTEAVESVLRQTFRDYGIVIADDGSQDGTVAIARRSAGPGARFTDDTHLGYPGNWARGLSACDGELVAFLSGDDTWLDRHLEIAIAALDAHPDAAFAYSYNEHVDVGLRPLPDAPRAVPGPPIGSVDPLRLLSTNAIETHSVVVRRSTVEAVGGPDPSLLFADVDLFVRLAQRHQVVHTGQITARYRRHDTGMSRDPQLMLEGWLDLYRRHLDGSRSTARRQLVAARYLDAAHAQARLGRAPELARRNLSIAIKTWPPIAWDRRSRAVTRATIRRACGETGAGPARYPAPRASAARQLPEDPRPSRQPHSRGG
jgi:glycosyltransferase involved in cell wall biosynthesis